MTGSSDQQLLRDFANLRSEAAFSELVHRHVDFVFSAALRMVRDAHLAEDVTQNVFVALAQNASQLTDRPSLNGWLHRSAQNLAANVVRAEVRRRNREKEAAVMNESSPLESAGAWEELAPNLDAALGELGDLDREVLLLRYFQKKSAREIAEIIGTSDEAAQKRVNRAVDRLRDVLADRGVVAGLGTAGLVSALATSSVQAAPAGLAAAISSFALMAQSPVVAATLFMTTAQKIAAALALTVTIGTAVFETRQAARAQHEAQSLREQQVALSGQLQEAQRQRDQARIAMADLSAQLAHTKTNAMELARLRGELARLRGNASDANDPFVQTALSWKQKKERLKKLFEEKPEQNIPELRLLDDQAWLNAAINANLDTDEGIRQAMSGLRMSAENQYLIQLTGALQKYRDANDGQFPTDLSKLVPFLDSPAADDLVQRYQLVPADQIPTEKLGGNFYITEKAAVDPDYDERWVIGQNGFGPTSFNPDPSQAAISSAARILGPALAAYSTANGGSEPSDPSQLQPYATTPDQQAALQQLLQYKTSFHPPR